MKVLETQLDLARLGLRWGYEETPTNFLKSGIKPLDAFFKGGLPFGAVTEWGVPMGREGRFVVLPFVAQATQGKSENPLWVLWVSGQSDLVPFPPAWITRGVNPRHLVFAMSDKPVEELKRALLSELFKVVILDSPRVLSKEDCAFLNQSARMHQQAVLLLRPYFLSRSNGNVWARLRLNCWKRHHQFILRPIRGLADQELFLKSGEGL